MARRPADDLGRGAADESLPAAGGRLHRVGIEALLGQDRRFVVRTAERVLADEAVAPDHSMARDDERHGVVSECRADGPDGLGPADLGAARAIRAALAPRDLERLAPHVLLEAGVTTEVERDPDAAIAVEPSSDRVRETGRDRGRGSPM